MVYEIGEAVFQEEPFAHVVSQEFRSKICDFCFTEGKKEVPLKGCIRCMMVFYCSKDCQTKAFNLYHKEECPYLRCQLAGWDKTGNFTH